MYLLGRLDYVPVNTSNISAHDRARLLWDEMLGVHNVSFGNPAAGSLIHWAID